PTCESERRCLDRAAGISPFHESGGSMTVGFFSPLPPSATGVADYSAALLEAMRKQGRVEVDAQRSDVSLYRIGNNHLHREIYARALSQPGVAVLHDA